MVVSNIFHFHPYLGKWPNLTNIFPMGWNHQLDSPYVRFINPHFFGAYMRGVFSSTTCQEWPQACELGKVNRKMRGPNGCSCDVGNEHRPFVFEALWNRTSSIEISLIWISHIWLHSMRWEISLFVSVGNRWVPGFLMPSLLVASLLQSQL